MKMSKEDFIYVFRGSSREDILNQYYWDRKDLMDKIDKAIEYIKQYGNLYCLKGKQFKDYQQYQDLLDILKGSDSNE